MSVPTPNPLLTLIAAEPGCGLASLLRGLPEGYDAYVDSQISVADACNELDAHCGGLTRRAGVAADEALKAAAVPDVWTPGPWPALDSVYASVTALLSPAISGLPGTAAWALSKITHTVVAGALPQGAGPW